MSKRWLSDYMDVQARWPAPTLRQSKLRQIWHTLTRGHRFGLWVEVNPETVHFDVTSKTLKVRKFQVKRRICICGSYDDVIYCELEGVFF